MSCARGSQIIICGCHAEGQTEIAGRIWKWTFHDYTGPTFYDARDKERKFPNERHIVWGEFNHWLWNHLKAKKDAQGILNMSQWYTPRETLP